jgi:hypothetical protein
LEKVVATTSGSIHWISELAGGGGIPELRRTRPGRDTAGRSWIGLQQNDSYIVTGIQQLPLLPGLLILLLGIAGLMAAWFREGKG